MASAYKATGINNLDFHVETETYYARIKLNGNTVRHAVGKNRETAKKLKNDWLEEMRGKNSGVDGTLGSLVEKYYQWLETQVALQEIRARNQEYKTSLVSAIRAVWEDFDKKRIGTLQKGNLIKFKTDMANKYSNTRVNGAITVIREIFNLAVTENVITRSDRDSLLEDLKYMPQDRDYQIELSHLPEPDVLATLRETIYKRCKNRGAKGHYLFDFLLFSGCRIESANEVFWEDVRWKRNELYFRKAKRGHTYTIPIFPELLKLLEQLKEETGGKPGERVLPTQSLQSVLTSACRELGIAHLHHHDLRHLFATRALEAGVDVATVAGWMGHRDNGRTVLAVYGHLRKTHSHELAKGMKFLPETPDAKKPAQDAKSMPIEAMDPGI